MAFELLEEVQNKYAKLTSNLIEKEFTISTMESCTSGLIASLLTDIDGASKAVKGGFVTYSNETKIVCGVPAGVIEEYGVYSKETAKEMAKRCRAAYSSNIGVGVTGLLGTSDPNNKGSLPGEVYFAIDYNGRVKVMYFNVPDQGSKFMNKVYAAGKICDELLEMFDEK